MSDTQSSHVDVLIVGAGLSGIGAGYHLQTRCPNKSYAILEGRERLGGTWDLFRFPGIRSDSDMCTFGYSFRPWTSDKTMADGPAILAYVRETAEMYGIDQKIRYGHRVERARWSTEKTRWTVEVRLASSGERVELSCNFLFMCAGYYDYDAGYTPEFAGRERFRGLVAHPQHWSDDIAYEGKRVVVIGSGATAVTMVPELAKKAAHVTMLQRSPTYIVSLPGQDKVGHWLRDRLPSEWAYSITRMKNVATSMAFYSFCRSFPAAAKKYLLDQVRRRVGDDVDVGKHFTPTYSPWDQRLCAVPNGDLFDAVRNGRASVVTDHIDSFTEKGIKLRSGEELLADLIVTATGLRLKFLGGLQMEVDGKPIGASDTLAYKGMMCSDIPNMALAFGYTNASWTLKCDLTSEYVCRLLNYMDDHGYAWCCARRNDPNLKEEPLLDFSSGYVQRSIRELPRQGSFAPWRLYQNYVLDRFTLRHARLDDSSMEFRARA